MGNKLTDKNRLSIKYPELCKEWDYNKNGKLRPENVSYGSDKKVWWKCSRGHSWEREIFGRTSRIKRNKCPLCSSLFYTNPDISKQWHPTKNKGLTSCDVLAGSNKKVWWKCKKGHEWIACVNNRCGAHSNCPYCSGNRVSEKNNLATHFPHLLDEWDYRKNDIIPSEISYGSNKRVWWRCKTNSSHIWSASINSRTSALSKCPYCLNRKVNVSNCISTTHSHLVDQWHPTKNKELTPHNTNIGYSKDVFWKCEKGHIYACPPQYKLDNDRRSKRNKGRKNLIGECPYCNNLKSCKSNCLATVNPKLSKEWHPTKNKGLTPHMVNSRYCKKVWWKCKKGHEWEASVNFRIRTSSKCSQCRKINFKDGTSWDSNVEAYMYLKFKDRGFKVESHKKYGFGRYMCDFYLPQTNTYIEVTSFSKKDSGWAKWLWGSYYKRIIKKKNYVKNVLKAKFKFIQLKLTKDQINLVRKNSI